MINKRGRKPNNPDLEKAKEATSNLEVARMTVYIPLTDKDALELYALKKRSSVSEEVRIIISDFVKRLK